MIPVSPVAEPRRNVQSALTWEDRESYPAGAEDAFKMQNAGRHPKILVSDGGPGIVSPGRPGPTA